jgi:hypothetical protein
MFIRLYRLEIQPVMFVFSTQLCELLPLSLSLLFNSPLSLLSCVNKYTVVMYMYTVCGGGGGDTGVQDCCKVPVQVHFFR